MSQENSKSLTLTFYGIILSMVGFFLFMFYKKVDAIGDNVHQININNAVKDERLNGISDRISNLEKAVNEFQFNQQIKKP